jgi:flagellar protein FliL
MAEKKQADKQVDAKGGGKKTLMFALVGVLLLAGVGVGGYLFGASRGAGAAPAAVDPAVAAAAAAAAEAEAGNLGPLVELKDFIVNILDEQETRYLKASLTLELSSPETLAEVEQRMPQVRDAAILLIGSKTFDELRDLQGKLQLRAELGAQINQFLKVGQVKNIYFTDFVVQ